MNASRFWLFRSLLTFSTKIIKIGIFSSISCNLWLCSDIICPLRSILFKTREGNVIKLNKYATTENASSWIKMIDSFVWTAAKTNHSWQESLNIIWSVNVEQSCWSDEMSVLTLRTLGTCTSQKHFLLVCKQYERNRVFHQLCVVNIYDQCFVEWILCKS